MTSLESTTWPQVGMPDLVIVPVGSLEQHGPHLPLHTDTTIAVAVAHGVAERLCAAAQKTVVTPPVAMGSSGEHQSFPGTVSIGTAVLRQVLVEIVRSVRTWADRVLLVNGHGGNVQAVRDAVDQLVHEGHDVRWVACRIEGADLHAGRTETSLMLALAPDEVRLDSSEPGNTLPLHKILPDMFAGGVSAVSANGVLGDPSGASAREGTAFLAAMVEEVLDGVLERRGSA